VTSHLRASARPSDVSYNCGKIRAATSGGGTGITLLMTARCLTLTFPPAHTSQSSILPVAPGVPARVIKRYSTPAISTPPFPRRSFPPRDPDPLSVSKTACGLPLSMQPRLCNVNSGASLFRVQISRMRKRNATSQSCCDESIDPLFDKGRDICYFHRAGSRWRAIVLETFRASRFDVTFRK